MTGDLGPFPTHLLAAIQSAEPEVGVDALALLEASGNAPTDAVLVSLINDLDVLAGPTVVALDDYHVIDELAVHEAVAFLVDNLPPQVTLAMSTRADPPLPLSRLRARGELVEVRAPDLRFTTAEAQLFLNEVMGLELEPALVSALEARTEGWAAGLQLAALSARSHAGAVGSGDVAGFVAAFAGSHRFDLDYLIEEVLDRQPEDVRAFLLNTCVLDQLTGGLCDALTGRADGQLMLQTLERENRFVVALDDERRWYRYHHLFADALRARLDARDGNRVGELHAAASRWLAESGLLTDAIQHAMESGDHEYTAELVELALADLRRRRQDRTLRDWLAGCPTTSFVADRCSPRSWDGAGCPRATSTGWKRGWTLPRLVSARCRQRLSARAAARHRRRPDRPAHQRDVGTHLPTGTRANPAHRPPEPAARHHRRHRPDLALPPA